MKTYAFFPLLACFVLSAALFSFSDKGGDVFAIYLNGKQVHRQFVHIDQSSKTLQLQTSGTNDRIEVLYSHCGKMGTNRVITLRNGKNDLLKELKFPDANNTNQSMMGFYLKDVPKAITSPFSLYYASTELPEGKLLAIISCNPEKAMAQP